MVGVQDDDDVGRVVGELTETGQHGRSVAPTWLMDDLGPTRARDRGGWVGRAVVGDDDPPDGGE